MFGDMMGNIEAQQKELKEKLKTVEVSTALQNGMIKVSANGNREITNIEISTELLEDKEQLEDLLVVALNDVLEKAASQEAMATKELMQKIMPPGMGGLGNLLG